MTNPKQIRIFKICPSDLPTLRAGPQFQMTKTLWPMCKLNRFEHLDIGILNLFGAWYLIFGIYSLRMRLRPLKNFPQQMLTVNDDD